MKNKYAVVVLLAVMGLSRMGLAAETASSPPGGAGGLEAKPAATPPPSAANQATAGADGAAAGAAPAAANHGAAAPDAGNEQAIRTAIAELLQGLVQQGVLTQEKAADIFQKMEQRLGSEAQAQRPPPPDPNVVGVPYVPQFIMDDIRDALRPEVRADVMNDITAKAKTENWGLPGVIPSILRRLHWFGDIKVRAQADTYAKDNAQNFYLNFQAVNQAGGIGKLSYPFIDTNVDRYRMRLRARLGLDADIADHVDAVFRISTGDTLGPPSVDATQNLGDNGAGYQTIWDQMFLRYKGQSASGRGQFMIAGGRLPDFWLHTNLVWADDLGFDGVVSNLAYNIGGATAQDRPEDPPTYLFLTAGAFPVQEIALSTRDKWLYAAQAGTDVGVTAQSRFKMGLAYYDFVHVAGERNTLDSTLLNFTAPQFVVKGNSMFDILNDTDPATNLFGLAADFHLVNLTASMDFAQFGATHIVVTGDYVKNIGFDERQVEQRTGVDIKPRTEGYQFMLAVGSPLIKRHGDWRITGAYKYLQRDAVIDAFTDADFHLGGTDAKGWTLQYDYGLTRNTALTVKWLSSDAIDGPPLGIDTLQVDINAWF